MRLHALLLSLLLCTTPLAAGIVRVMVPGEQVTALALGPDGNVWTTSYGNGTPICRITPSGSLTCFDASQGGGALLGALTTGPDGALWFPRSSFPGASAGRITTSGTITKFPLAADGGRAFGIAAGPDGALWIARVSSIDRVTTASVATSFPIETTTTLPGRIAAAPDGTMWFSGSGRIRRITSNGTVSVVEASAPPEAALATAPDGSIWYAGPGKSLVRVDAQGTRTVLAVPETAGSVDAIAFAPDGSVWIAGAHGLGHVQGAAIDAYPLPEPSNAGETWERRALAITPNGRIWYAQDWLRQTSQSLATATQQKPVTNIPPPPMTEVIGVDPASLPLLAPAAVPMNGTIALLLFGVAIVAVALLRLR